MILAKEYIARVQAQVGVRFAGSSKYVLSQHLQNIINILSSSFNKSKRQFFCFSFIYLFILHTHVVVALATLDMSRTRYIGSLWPLPTIMAYTCTLIRKKKPSDIHACFTT